MSILRSSLILCLLLSCLAWFSLTNQGLRVILTTASVFAPAKISYGNLKGSLLSDSIVIDNLQVTKDGHVVKLAGVEINPWKLQLNAYEIIGWANYIPENKIALIDRDAKLDHLQANVTLYRNHEDISIKTSGSWMQQPASANLNLTHEVNKWHIRSLEIKVSDNVLQVQNAESDFSWQICMPQPELLLNESNGKLLAYGTLRLDSGPQIEAEVTADNFSINNNNIQKLSAKLYMGDKFNINATAKQLSISGKLINNVSITTNGNKTLRKNSWYSEELIVKIDDYIIPGAIEYDFDKNKLHLSANDSWYDAKLNIFFNTQTISGKIDAHTDDISEIMRYVPEMTRLKGDATATANISGTFTAPLIQANAHIKNITATFPAIGVKVKPMELHIRTEKFRRFIISGKGNMRRGPGEFTIDGYIDPFEPNIPNQIKLVGKQVEFINNDMANLIASTDLNFVYNLDQSLLNITGDFQIESGTINFEQKDASTTKSKDVVFVNEIDANPKHLVRINPNIFLRLNEGIRFKGLALDAIISGKLDINQRHEAVYANGRITIKEGTYKLPGQEFHISKGRLLYPPGTLLANPVIDIKMIAGTQEGDLEIQVSGTVQNPVISESGLAENQDKALSQALLTSSGVLTKDLLRDKLKLTELGITSEDDHNIDFFDNPANAKNEFKNKQFVIGRALSKRLHAQYLHSMDETRKRLRLKFAISEHWEIGVEGGDQGAGADLSFVIERD